MGILLSKEHFAFSKYELSTVFDNDEIEYTDNLAVIETDDISRFNERLDILSYAKEAYELMAQADDWDQMLRDVEEADITQFAFPDETYKVDSLRIGNTHQATDRGLLAGLTNTTGELQVDVENPDALFVHLKGDKHSYGRKIWENTEPFTNRRNDNLPASHPTGMDPRRGRAMINIAQADEHILDPFCGAGGLLLEAGLLGFKVTGIDHDSRMIERAQTNLDAFDIDAELIHGDALDEPFDADTVVTDVPYGRNSTTSKPADELFASFLERLGDSDVKRAVICHPAEESFSDLISVLDDNPESFDFYVNSNLTRRITVLQLT